MGWIGAEKCLAKYPKDIEFSPIRYIDSNRYKLAAMGSLNCSNRPGFLSLVILFAAAAVFCAYSQEKPSVAVLPFEPLNLQETDAGLAYSLFEQALIETGVYTVLSKDERDRILAAAGDSPFPCTEEDCAVEIGRTLSVQQVVLATVARSGGRYIVNAKIIEVAAAATLAADSVSASDKEQLSLACSQLAVSLVRKAVPGSLPEPSHAGEGPETAAGGAQPPSAEPTPEERRGLEEEEKLPAEYSRADVWSLVTICSGIFLLETGNIAAAASFELHRKISDTYFEYERTSWNFDELWRSDSSARFGYYFSTTLSYLSWTLGVASIPTYLYLFPEQAFSLSRWGRIIFTVGTALSIGGNVLDLLACTQRYRNDFLYEDYQAAGTDVDELKTRYDRGYVLYSVERLTSYAFWLIGGGGMITAFFIPGEKRSSIVGFWDKASLIAGVSLVATGSLTRTLALNYRQTFIESDGKKDTAYDRYVLCSVLSYGFWAVGGTAMLLPLFVDLGKTPADSEIEEPRSEALRLVPLPNGLILQYSW